MRVPQLLVDLLQLLFDMVVPAAMCTMVLARLALRQESGVNFEIGGRFQRWMLWSVILLILPQTRAAGRWMAVAGAVVLILTQGRSQKSPIMKFLICRYYSLLARRNALGMSNKRELSLGEAYTVSRTLPLLRWSP